MFFNSINDFLLAFVVLVAVVVVAAAGVEEVDDGVASVGNVARAGLGGAFILG